MGRLVEQNFSCMLTYYVSGNTIISYSYVPACNSSEGLITAQDCNFDACTENAKE